MITDYLLFFFYLAVSFSGTLCSLVLLLLNKAEKFANRLLAAGLFNISAVLLLNGLTYVDGFYIEFPHTYRLGIFTQYLLAPFFYLYVRAVINQESALKKWDWLHFLPALLHFIEFIPFYLLSTEEKREYLIFAFSHIEILSRQQEGMLPANFHPFLKSLVGIVYCFFQSKILLLVYLNRRKWLKKNKAVWLWLVRLTIFHLLTYVFVLMSYILFFNAADMRFYSISALGLIQFFCTINLLFNPRILYGMKENDDVSVSVKELIEVQKKDVVPLFKMEEYKEVLRSFMLNERPYLRKKYSIRNLALDCGIPVHHLSVLINNQYKCNYNDFINGYRVMFIVENRHKDSWSSYSLEGLASEAGFNSRNSFFNAFKKKMGCTPHQYFTRNQNEGSFSG